MKKNFLKSILILLMLANGFVAQAIVLYDEGSLVINNVQLLRDKDDPKKFYYIPQYPHLSVKPDSTFEFLCMKYVGEKGDASGGLFHALIEFTLPTPLVVEIEKELKKKVPGSYIAGAVPMMQAAAKEGEDAPARFEIVSAVLGSVEGKEALTRNVVASGFAPLTPGSKAAIAALLNQQGATLLWNSLTGPTSDVSVSVHGYYEAAVKAYNAVVTAEMKTMYSHFSEISNKQKDFTKDQIRFVVDSLTRLGSMKVDVFDRSQALGVKSGDMEAILSLITNKLTEIMFDTKAGWAQDPKRVDQTEGFKDPGRQEESTGEEVGGAIANALSLGFSGWLNPRDKNTKYITDDQYVLKDITDIRTNKFYLNLSKSTTIKVPIHSSGNIGGIYQQHGTDDRYFRIVNMNDPAFQKREIHFQVDGEFTDAFDDLINFVAVNFRKKYAQGDDVTEKLFFNATDLKAGTNLKSVSFPRLGNESAGWIEYEYQILWSLKGSTKVIRIPSDENQWVKTSDPSVSLVAPFEKMYIEVDADRALFKDKEMVSANLNFASTLAGEKKIMRNLTLRATDAESTSRISVYHDPRTPIVYRTTWYSAQGQKEMPLAELKNNYLLLIPAEN